MLYRAQGQRYKYEDNSRDWSNINKLRIGKDKVTPFEQFIEYIRGPGLCHDDSQIMLGKLGDGME